MALGRLLRERGAVNPPIGESDSASVPVGANCHADLLQPLGTLLVANRTGGNLMQPFKRILVPVDFSPCSSVALDRAADLASSLNATIDLLHVWQTPPIVAPEAMVGMTGDHQSLAQIAKQQAESAMAEFADRARESGKRIGKVRVEPGDPARTIVDEADRGNYDLIAMGTHGRSGLAHLLLGSVAEKVVRRASRPVLTVPEGRARSASRA
jgi:nucleotide-binding universal stress UspA family protein